MELKNAKNELLSILNPKNIKCAEVDAEVAHSTDGAYAKLRENWTQEDLDLFLYDLDFEYDAGYGSQKVYGTIWMKDGTWYTRREYDGAEWWERHSLPEVPKHLQAK